MKYFFLINWGEGGRTGLIQGTTDICEVGAYINQHIRVIMGCDRRPRASVCSRNGGRGVIWH
jgi:hypothetical protein